MAFRVKNCVSNSGLLGSVYIPCAGPDADMGYTIEFAVLHKKFVWRKDSSSQWVELFDLEELQGVSVVGAHFDEDGCLFIELSDGNEINVGPLIVEVPNTVSFVESSDMLPEEGEPKILYVTENTGTIYQWNEEQQDYQPLNATAEVEVIFNGGNAD